jgi:hypothetical protein
MRLVGPASEAEVVAAFLRAELDSPRYGATISKLLGDAGLHESIVRRPTFASAAENAERDALLERHRAWLRREGLFNGFPDGVEWFRAALSPELVLSILYINWDWWLRATGGTRRPLDAADRIRRNEVEGSTAEALQPIAARLRSLEPPPELIVAAPPDYSRLVLVEGHVRLTAYALYPEYLPDELEVFLGTSEEITGWSQF